ncbi:hypothetical protein [Gimesia chilikensis]|uniref:Uncharacterized protein n=1 Tax=Gimesia chilikensis TaxID=2605989 RepID=A0A517PLA4_9PLAN|nr:hypothetical protein [Gimesia chilikensis]QDT20149.1 hypothetical protein HG66A1_19340 [Gimesia chilikensis]
MNSLYCTAFVRTNLNYLDFIHVVESILAAKSENANIETEDLDIFIDKNDDYDPEKIDMIDGFLFYPYRMEINPTKGATQYKEALLKFIRRLREKNYDVVPACDFEEYLNSQER